MSRPVILRFIGDAKGLTSVFGELMATSGLVDRRFRGMARSAASLRAVGGALNKYVSLPILGIVAASADMAVHYQTAVTKLGALAGVSQRQMGSWSKSILEVAKTLPQGPIELANAMYFVASSGFRGAEAMDILKASAKGAAIGMGETGTIARMLDATLNAYHGTGLTATRAMDALIGAIRQGDLPADEMALALGNVLSIAAQMKVPITDLTAAIASASKQGIDASRASQGLRFMLARLLHPANQSVEILNKFGIASTDLQKAIAQKGLLPTLAALKQRLGAENFAQVLGGARGLTVGLALVGRNADQVREVFRKTEQSTGTLNKAFKQTSQTAEFKFHTALSSLQVAGVKIGSVLLPYLAQAADALARLADKFSGLNPHVQKVILTIGLIAAVVGPSLVMLASLMRAFITLASVAMSIGRGVMYVVNSFRMLIAIFRIGGLAALGPIGWIAIAVIALGAAFVIAYKRSATFRAIVHASLHAVAVAAKATAAFFVRAWGAVERVTGKVVGFITREWRKFTGPIIGYVKARIAEFSAFWKQHGQQIVTIAKFVWKVVSTVVRYYLKALWFEVRLWWTYIKNVILTTMRVVWAFLRPALHRIADAFKFAFHLISNIVKTAFHFIGNVFKFWWHLALNTLGLFADLFTGKWGRLWGDVRHLVGQALGDIGHTFWQFAKDAIHLLYQAGKDIVLGLVHGIKDFAMAPVHAIVAVGKGIVSGAKDILHINSPSRDFYEIGAGVNEGFMAGIVDTGHQVVSAIASVATQAVAQASRITSAIQQAQLAKHMRLDAAVDDRGVVKSGKPKRWAPLKDVFPNTTSIGEDSGGGTSKAEERKRKAQEAAKALHAALRQIAHSATAGFAVAARQSTDKMREVVGKMFDALKAGIKAKAPGATKSLLGHLKDENRHLNDLARERESIGRKLSKAGESLKAALQARKDFATNFVSSVLGGMDITSAEPAREGAALTTADVLANFAKQSAGAVAFSDQIKQLAALGLSRSLLNQLINAGAEQGGATAAALLSGGADAVTQANDLQRKASTAAKAIGAKLGAQFYNEGIRQAQALVKGLKSQETRIADAMARLVHRMAKALNGIIPATGRKHAKHHAFGGIVDTPTYALIGEAGPELVLPLTRASRSLALLSQAGVRQRTSSGSAGASVAATNTRRSRDSGVLIENLHVTQKGLSRPEDTAYEIAWALKTRR